jgi:hypothetical protein
MKYRKVHFFDKTLRKSYLSILASIGAISTLVLVFFHPPDTYKLLTFSILVFSLIVLYLIMWVCANRTKRIKLSINGSRIIIKTGDIFKEENTLKVIPFNEYFDTIVDDKIIAKSTLNGIVIQKHIKDIKLLDEEIDQNVHLSKRKQTLYETRSCGKKQKYKLGSIHKHNEFMLTAFTKFDDENRANLSLNDYIMCLLNFWNELDIVYASKSISIPVLGTGITRSKGHNKFTEQEKLEMLLWSFKISQVSFSHTTSIKIIIHENMFGKIDLFKIKGLYP